jgi:hypothetical protein
MDAVFIINTGTVELAQTSTTVTFAKAHANTNYIALVSAQINSDVDAAHAYIKSKTTTNMVIANAYAGTVTMNWMTIGA